MERFSLATGTPDKSFVPVAHPLQRSNLNIFSCFAVSEEQEIGTGTIQALRWFPVFVTDKFFQTHTDVIAQSLKNGTEL